MKKAIKRVFLNAYHRLCVWNLIRNAMFNIGVPEFVGQFRKCMLGDYDLSESQHKWVETIGAFGLHDTSELFNYMKRERCGLKHI